jgi:hypothetical protein
VPVAADADEVLSEPDRLEERGTALGRKEPTGDSSSSQQGAAEALSCIAASGERAMAPHAASAACVEPSSESSSEKNKNENSQGQLQPQSPSRAMTSHAMSAACADPTEMSSSRRTRRTSTTMDGCTCRMPTGRWHRTPCRLRVLIPPAASDTRRRTTITSRDICSRTFPPGL